MVRLTGIEPARFSTPDPKSGAATNFATGATNRGRTLPYRDLAFKIKQEGLCL